MGVLLRINVPYLPSSSQSPLKVKKICNNIEKSIINFSNALYLGIVEKFTEDVFTNKIKD